MGAERECGHDCAQELKEEKARKAAEEAEEIRQEVRDCGCCCVGAGASCGGVLAWAARVGHGCGHAASKVPARRVQNIKMKQKVAAKTKGGDAKELDNTIKNERRPLPPSLKRRRQNRTTSNSARSFRGCRHGGELACYDL